MFTLENLVREAKGLTALDAEVFAEALEEPKVAEALKEMEQAEL